jgi:hypothetical protein
MSKFSRIVVLVTALASLFAVMSSTAGATTFTNTNASGTSFHAIGGAGTLAVTRHPGVGSNLTCTASTGTGSIPFGTFTSVSGTVNFNPCSLAGTPSTVACSFVLTPTVFNAGSPAVTNGTAAVNCTASVGGVALCKINGNTPGHYINPGAAAGKVTLTSSSTLTVTHNSGTTCSALLGTTTSGTGHLTEQTLTLQGAIANQPVVASP